MITQKRITVDITPKLVLDEDTLAKIKSAAVGQPFKNEKGELIGEIRKASIKDGRLMAEIQLTPGVILG